MHIKVKIENPIQINNPSVSARTLRSVFSSVIVGSPTPFGCGVLFYRSSFWMYTATTAAPAGRSVVVEVTAYDHPGNKGRLSGVANVN